MRLPIKAYHDQKHSSGKRGIPFLLTFEEWLKIWTDSGRLDQRGRFADNYCMARFGDRGSYVVGNVRIITSAQNRAEQELSAQTRAKMRAAKFGTRQSEATKATRSASLRGTKHTTETRQRMSDAKVGHKNPMFGRAVSPETRAKLSAARTGRTHSAETRAKISAARTRYWESRA